jgi:hypothetical protein
MPITYDLTYNNIIVTGYTETAPCTFTDLYNADKAGSLQLKAPVAAALDLSLDRQIRPADDKALKLNIIITNFSVAGEVTLTGLDKDGNAQTETISISANGTYVTTKWFKSIDTGGVDCTGTYTIEITQSRWGVVWKEDNSFIFNCGIVIGDGTTTTWFIDTQKQVLFKSTAPATFFNVKDNANLRFGTLIDATSKITKNGCTFIGFRTSATNFIVTQSDAANLEIFSSYFISPNALATVNPRGGDKIYNSVFDNVRVVSPSTVAVDFYDIEVKNVHAAQYAFRGVGTMDRVMIYDVDYAIYFVGYIQATLKNLIVRNVSLSTILAASITTNDYLINADLDNWTITWSGSSTGKFFRQYEFDLTVIDKDNNPISDAIVTLKDKNGTQVFSATTDINGKIPTQTVSYGWYEQATGDTLNSYSPHTLTISKAGYQIYTKKFTLDKKIDWRIKLTKAVDIAIEQGSGRLLLNLNEQDPESEEYLML